jgi:hypothetical protein
VTVPGSQAAHFGAGRWTRANPTTRLTTIVAAPTAASVTTMSCSDSSIVDSYETPADRKPWCTRKAATYASPDM